MAVKVTVYGEAKMQQIQNARKELDLLESNARKNATGFKGSMGRIGSAVSSTGAKFASGFAAMGIASWLKGSLEVARAVEESQGMLQKAIENTGGSWEQYDKKVTSTIAKQSQISAFSKGTLRDALTQLVTTTGKANISTDLLGVTTDLARRKHMDLSQAAVLVGKAYNGNITSLKRLGIELPKGSKGMEVIDALQKRVAGSAEEYGSSSAGAADKFSNSLKGLQATIGTQLLPYANRLMTSLVSLINKFQALPGPVKNVIVGVAGFAAASLIIAPFITSIQTVTKAMKLAQAASKIWAGVQWLLNAAMSANPIALVVIAIAALVGGIIYAYKHSETFRRIVQGAWSAVKSTVLGAIDAIKTKFEALKKVFSSAINFFKGIGQAIVDGLKNGISSAWNGLVNMVKGLTDHLPSVVKKALGIASPSKVFHQIGVNIGQGLTNGISSTQGMVQSAVSGLSMQTASSGYGSLSASPSANYGGNRSVTIAPGAVQISFAGSGSLSDAQSIGDELVRRIVRELRAR